MQTSLKHSEGVTDGSGISELFSVINWNFQIYSVVQQMLIADLEFFNEFSSFVGWNLQTSLHHLEMVADER